MFHEVWIIREIMVLTMFKHKDAVILQQVVLKDEAGDGGQFLQGVGGIGKDEVKLLLARLDESERIATQGRNPSGVLQFL